MCVCVSASWGDVTQNQKCKKGHCINPFCNADFSCSDGIYLYIYMCVHVLMYVCVLFGCILIYLYAIVCTCVWEGVMLFIFKS